MLRDRIIALGVRRPLQITPDHFDISQDVVTELDISGEMEQSQVYDAETKLLLAKIFIVQCHFAMAVTSTIMAIYPLDGVVIPALPTPPRISELRIRMGEWLYAFSQWFYADYGAYTELHIDRCLCLMQRYHYSLQFIFKYARYGP